MSPFPRYILDVVTAPTGVVIDPVEMETYLRFCDPSEQPLIVDLIAAATEFVEKGSGRQFLTATYDLLRDRFPCGAGPIVLPKPPLQSVTSISYVDGNGTTQTLSASLYEVQAGTEHAAGYILPDYGTIWPATRGFDRDVTIRFVCGYGLQGLVPQVIKQQIRMLVKHWFENRSAIGCGEMTVPPLAYDALASFNRHHEFV